MCVLSAVHDHFSPLIPGIPAPGTPTAPWAPWIPTAPAPTDPVQGPVDPAFQAQVVAALQLAELRSLIDRFERAVAAAKVVDELTGQPDCLDPAKAKLEDRVAYWKARALAAETLIEAGT